jgi:hypothetical protein
MASTFPNVFSSEELEWILRLPEVAAAREQVETTTKVYFTIPLTETIRTALSTRFNLSLPETVSEIPMRWIKGDTAGHADVGRSKFQYTSLVYLTSSDGSLIVGDSEYPIEANTGCRFSEGIPHETIGTGTTPRLLLGPMNEFAEPVGATNVYYYPNEANALAQKNAIGSGDYTVQTIGEYSSWILSSNSTGPSSKAVVYVTGNVLNSSGSYNLYPVIPCFLEGTDILCSVNGTEVYLPVESLTPGTQVKTTSGAFKKVAAIGKGTIANPGNSERTKNRLYRLTPAAYPQLTKDLYITGCHSILLDSLSQEQREAINKYLENIFFIDGKYRLMACIDERAEPWNSGATYPIWHFALENDDVKMNYGLYVNGGLLVEKSSINFLKNKSSMTIV